MSLIKAAGKLTLLLIMVKIHHQFNPFHYRVLYVDLKQCWTKNNVLLIISNLCTYVGKIHHDITVLDQGINNICIFVCELL